METYDEQLLTINQRLTALGLDYKNVADWLELTRPGAWLKLNGERQFTYDELRTVLNQLTVEETVREVIQNADDTTTRE